MNPYLAKILRVNKCAVHVKIDFERIAGLAKEMAPQDMQIPSWDFWPFPEDEQFADFIFWASAINFCFTDFTTGRSYEVEYPQGTINKGAYAMFASFRKAMDVGVPVLCAEYWETVSLNEFSGLFAGNYTDKTVMQWRHECLRRNAVILSRYYDGKVENIFKAGEYRCFNGGGGFVELLGAFPAFSDWAIYDVHGKNPTFLGFYKKAMLMAMIYQGRALSKNGETLPLLNGQEHLMLPADYRVPQALQHLGILKYSEELTEDIARGRFILSGEKREIEIRAQSVHAAHRLIAEINEIRTVRGLAMVTVLEVDYFLWKMGRTVTGKHHYTKTINY